MDRTQFKGTGVALATPFTTEKEVDVKALGRLVNFQIDNGIDYIVVLGTTAESATLSVAEKELVKKTIREANDGRLPLVLGLGSNNTADLIQAYQKKISKGLMLFYLFRHFIINRHKKAFISISAVWQRFQNCQLFSIMFLDERDRIWLRKL